MRSGLTYTNLSFVVPALRSCAALQWRKSRSVFCILLYCFEVYNLKDSTTIIRMMHVPRGFRQIYYLKLYDNVQPIFLIGKKQRGIKEVTPHIVRAQTNKRSTYEKKKRSSKKERRAIPEKPTYTAAAAAANDP